MRKILVVEDDRFISAIFTMFLRDIGHEMVGRCQSGREALELCRSLNPDVILMDIHLEGDWDGIQTADHITRELHIPVIFVSSDTDNEVINRAIISNSYGYLVKPIDKKELAISIDLAYYKHRVDQELKQREKGYRQFISDSPLPIMIVSNGKIQYINNNALSLLRSHYIEDLMGLPFFNFVASTITPDLEALMVQHDGVVVKNPVFRLRMKDIHGNVFYAELLISSVEFNHKTSLQIILRNLSRELKMELRLDALEYVVKSGINRFFLISSDLLLLDFSGALAELSAGSGSGEADVRLTSQTISILGKDGDDQFNHIFFGHDSLDGKVVHVSINNNPMGAFSVRKIVSSVGEYFGVLFYDCP